jgi:hypothetical protein
MNRAGSTKGAIMSARSRSAEDTARSTSELTTAAAAPTAEYVERWQKAGVAIARDGAAARARIAREGGQAAGELSRQALDEAASAAPGMVDFGRLWFSWWPEQIQDGWRATLALARCRNLGEVAQVQGEFFRSSLGRFARCLDVSPDASRG